MAEERRKISFTQILRMPIGRARHLVLSKAPTGNYSLAQQLEATDDDGSTFNVFLKNAAILSEEKLIDFSDQLQQFVKSLKNS